MSSTTMQASERLVCASDFVDAVARRQWDHADGLMADLGGMQPDGVWSAIATLHMQRERWDDAAAALGHLKNPDSQQKLHLNLTRNLDCLKTHRPEIYRIIADADFGDAYRIHPSKSGKPTILATRADGSKLLLAGAHDPQKAGKDVCASLAPHSDKGIALGILSIGDGYVFDAIVRNPPVLFMDRKQAIHLIEPDPRLILACLLIHDLTGANGPIESEQVQWFVGPKWADQFRIATLTDRYLPFPQVTVKLGTDAQPLEAVIQSTLAELGKMDAAYTQQIAHYYAKRTGDDFAKALHGQSDRAARVLLITTRFSTVLQHSTRDAADAFRQIGCEALVMIEPSPHHGLTRLGMRRTLAEFKPDLIFQIDHNRFEHADLFPANIPFVNWIQDMLPHLMKIETGRKLGARDYVLTPSLQRWVDDYAYPARQCLEFRKLTRIPTRPISWAARANQVVYVSNWSQTPETIKDELLRNESGESRKVIEAACQRIIATYMAGESLASQGDVRRALIDTMRNCQVAADEALIRNTTVRLFDRLNNLMFRQQGLRWAIQSCRQLDLDLQIYGKGWNENPEFSRHARGEVGYGQELEDLTRSAGVNLVLEPFVCIAHQRLLDALTAGGFCLIRSNPANHTIQSMLDLLGFGSGSSTTAELCKRLPTNLLPELEQTLTANDALDASPGAVDHVAIVKQMQDAGFLPTDGPLIPVLDQTTFTNQSGLQELLCRFVRDDGLRSDIARTQRQAIEKRYSYTAGMKRVIEWVAARLESEIMPLEKAA